MPINFLRVFKLGWQELLRNIGVSLGTVFIMFIALSLLSGTILLKGVTDNLIATLKAKVDISVYFNLDTKEDDIFEVKEKIENFPEIEKVYYTSREKALRTFKDTHEEDPQMLEALEEIGENPLPASLNIRASTASAYAALSDFLEKGEFKDMVEKVNYRQNQLIIEKLFSISDIIKKAGIGSTLILIFIAIAVTFNTVRLAIYAKRREIEIMKLIGGTDWFVRGPFLVHGLILGLFAGIVSFIIFYIFNVLFSSQTSGILGELGFLDFFSKNVLLILIIQLGGGVSLGVISSFLASQKYLKV
ncbi:MAG: permease-like cell division protein FtsX [Candidatus Bathyarchaeota archaeon]|nr:permease-like cell division protein FtsX [Candidatus Bathyarchaeota archaeon]